MTLEGVSPSKERLGLVLCLIPAVPEALLVRAKAGSAASSGGGWKILARSRTLDAAQSSIDFSPPTGSQAPESPVVRADFFRKPDAFFGVLEKELGLEAFEVRLRAAERELKDLIKQARETHDQTKRRRAQGGAGREADWQRYGELLGSPSLHDLPKADAQGERLLTDYATEAQVSVPCDPKLGPSEQVEKFFQLARRRIAEGRRSQAPDRDFVAKTRRAGRPRWPPLPRPGDWPALEKLERLARTRAANPAQAARSPGKGKVSSWLGKSFTSKDGLVILAGRSKDENLELTFKHARGGDVWLHVRGRPGAHILVPLTSGKSAPLETLLDAATLAIYYSGGEKWGKTEVDYTFKKYVRRIKDSTEASYTHNKTLILEPDPARIKRLLGVARDLNHFPR